MIAGAKLGRFSLALAAAILLSATPAFAACTSPAGNEGDVNYAAVQHIMAYCNGSSWVAMGSSSSATFGTLTTNDFCTAASSSSIQCTTAYTGSGNVVLATSPTITTPHLTGPTVDSGGLTVSAGGASITGTVTGTTFSGSGASLTSIGTTNMTAVTGTPNATTYLRGDNTWSAISLGTASLTGVVTVPQGGTGDTTLTAHGLMVGNGTNAVAVTGTGASGALLLGQGGSADPSFATMSQDCTITNAGVITCTKTNNVAFGTLATLNAAPAGTLTGTTLASNVVSSSLTGVGTITSGTWNGNAIGIGYGGTNATSQTTNGVNYYNGTSITSGSGFVYNGSSVGIGTATPTAALTVNGTSAFQFGTDFSTTGTQSDVNLGSASSVRYTGAGTATFNGISGGVNGRVLHLHNGSSSTLTLANKASADTTYANQIVTGTSSDLSVASNSAAILQYDASATNSNGASGAWRVIGGSVSGGVSGGTANYVPLWTSATTLGTSALYQSGSYVGIGTTGPNYLLDVEAPGTGSVGTVIVNATQPALATGNTAQIYLGKAGVSNQVAILGYTYNSSGTGGNSYLSLGLWGSSNALSINGSGNVGIGVTGAAQTLQVGGTELINTGYGSGSIYSDLDIGGINGWVPGDTHTINFVYGTAASPTVFNSIQSKFDGTNAIFNLVNTYNSTTPVMTLKAGNVGIGTTGPYTTLDVAGTIYSRSYNAGSSTSIDWSLGNIQYTSASCGSFTFSNMQDGGSYTLAIEGTTSGTCSFSETGFTFKYPPGHTSTTGGNMTLYSFSRIGTYVFITWIPGY